MPIRRVFARAVASAALAVFALPGAASAAFPWPMTVTATPAEALPVLNAYRAAAGEQPVADMVPAWNQACAKHVAYETQNSVLTHVESPSAPGYSVDGAWAGKAAVLSSGRGNPSMWDSAVYHRLGVLAPRLRHSGWAVGTARFSCMIVHGADAGGGALDPAAGTPGLTLHPWPYDGATGVPTNFPNNESPSPATDAGGTVPRGYLLSVSVNGPWSGSTAQSTDVTAASLTPDGGSALAIAISDRDSPNRDYLSGGMGLFPLAVLAAGTWFTAHAEGQVIATDYALAGAPTTRHPFSLTWRFRTGGPTPPPVYTDPPPPVTPAPPSPSAPAPAPVAAAPIPENATPGAAARSGGRRTGAAGTSLTGTARHQGRAGLLRRGLLVRGRLTAPARLRITITAGSRVIARAVSARRQAGSWSRRVRLSVGGRRVLARIRGSVRVVVAVSSSAGPGRADRAETRRVAVTLS